MRRPSTVYRSVLPAALALMLAQGCSQLRAPGSASATAPALGEEGQAHIRGVSDPNAQFTLMERPAAVARQASNRDTGQNATGDAFSTPLCDRSSLQVYESAATTNGEERGLRLAIRNNGEASCRLDGSPTISLLDESGAAIASIAVRQTGASSLTGVVGPPMREAASTSASPAQGVDFVLEPSGEASLEIGWSSGEDCPAVASIALGMAPSSDADGAPTPTFAINHSLKVCGGEVRVTSLLTGGSV